jgi:hypothetical protein
MTDKTILQLPLATTPLSGNESLVMLQGPNNTRSRVAVSQVLPTYGDMPTNRPIGSMGYVADAIGGPTPAYWTGSNWKPFVAGGGTVKTGPQGFWIVGGGLSTIPERVASPVERVTGYYWTSTDGFQWIKGSLLMDAGIYDISYANGALLFSGSNLGSACIKQTDIITPVFDNSSPFGFQDTIGAGTVAAGAQSFNNTTGIFNVVIRAPGGGTSTQQIQNKLPAAVTPAANWPTIGAPFLGEVIGIGLQGPVSVRLNSTFITFSGIQYVTNYLQARRLNPNFMATEDWITVFEIFYSDFQPAPGVVFNGLNFGIIKQTAVQLQPGSQ